MQTISTTKAPQAIGPYSQAKMFGNFLFTSGQIALKPNGEFVQGCVATQTHQVFKNLQAVLEEAGLSFNDVIKTTVYLVDLSFFESMNDVYAQYFTENKPARSTLGVKELPRGAEVEIELIAVKK